MDLLMERVPGMSLWDNLSSSGEKTEFGETQVTQPAGMLNGPPEHINARKGEALC